MPALRLLTPWPWGCPRKLAEVPEGNFRFAPNENNYWLEGSLARVMRWYYQVKTWRIEGQPFWGTSDTPAGAQMVGEFSFNQATDVVCGRNGFKIAVFGTTPENRQMGLEFFLFLPHPSDFQGNADLRREYSVVKTGEESYAPFCFISGFFFIGPTGALGFNTNFLPSREYVDLNFDGLQIFQRTTSQFDLSWKVTVTPAEFFDFSD